MRLLAPVAVIVPSPTLSKVTAKFFFVKVALTVILSLTTIFFVARISVPLAVRAVSS